MLKKVFGRKLSRAQGARKALFRSLMRSLVLHGKITTTHAKAKAVHSSLEKIMTKVKSGTLTDRRLVFSSLGNDKEVTDKLFSEFGEVVAKRQSGFIRIMSLPARQGDNAKMAVLEFVDKPSQKSQMKKKESKK